MREYVNYKLNESKNNEINLVLLSRDEEDRLFTVN